MCRLVEAHPEAETHAVEDLLDLVQRLAPEVLRLEHFCFGFLHELANGADVRVLQAVVRTDSSSSSTLLSRFSLSAPARGVSDCASCSSPASSRLMKMFR